MEQLREKNRSAAAIANEVASRLQRGEVLVLPTDTLYGLVADATNTRAVWRIFRIKGRARKPLPIFVADITMARAYAHISREAEPILREFWPGALTAVFLRRAKTRLSSAAVCGEKTVALRVPRVSWLRAAIRALGKPLTGTSANISGKTPVASGKAAVALFSPLPESWQPDAVYYGGRRSGKASTIVDFSVRPWRVLRSGKGYRRIKEQLNRLFL